jgi:hypothetical protein
MTDHPDRRDLMRMPLAAAALTALPLAAHATAPVSARAPGAPTDFDFLHGSWRIAHRQLKDRLAGSTEWIEFEGTCLCQPLLGGFGNMDDNVLNKPEGAYRAVTLRAYDPEARVWRIWWLDARAFERLDPPMQGAFKDGVGTFLTDDVFRDKPIKVRFLWTHEGSDKAEWRQAFSPDGGATWEENWVMRFERMG